MSKVKGFDLSNSTVLKKLVRNKKILCVGLANVDNVLICSCYPKEDSDERCVIDQRTQVGGNTANNCSVLAALGVNCEFMGSLSNCNNTNFITEHFRKSKISFDHCAYHAIHCGDRVFPNTTIIINDTTGSRTIFHFNRNWPELTLEDFQKLDLSQYSWIYFEGRNIHGVKAMIEHIDSWRKVNPNSSLRISVELEMPNEEVAELIPLADFVFVGKEYAIYRGWQTMSEALEQIATFVKPSATAIVPWGELGAIGRSPEGNVAQSPVYSPSKVIDTLGAGDTFSAATIAALNSGCTLQESITFGCQVAGTKVGMYGYEGLKKYCIK